MRDTRLHNDCDGGQCCACEMDRQRELLSRDRRAWFDPDANGVMAEGNVWISDAVNEYIHDLERAGNAIRNSSPLQKALQAWRMKD